jgi:CheY-like chemotaxis protein
MEAILQAANSSAEIAQQLLTLSRRQVMATEILDVNDCVRRMGHMVGPTLGADVRLNTDFHPSSGRVRMNLSQFNQVILNLLFNARDAMPNGGSILISTMPEEIFPGDPARPSADRLSGSYARILVTDSGVGIGPELREHIFDPFFTTKPAGKGAGMGLALVYGIVKDAGGEITFRSTAGLGACFDVLLPRVEEDDSTRKSAAKVAEAHPANPKTILLVEDQSAIRGLIHNYFEKKGFRLIAAEHGKEALDLSEMFDGNIDLLISDVVMPKIDGPTLANRLSLTRPAMKTLFISGHPGDSIEALKNAAGGAEFLQKPFTLPALFEKVKALTS